MAGAHDDVRGCRRARGDCQRTFDVLHRERRTARWTPELADLDIAQKFVHERARAARCHEGDVDVLTPARGNVEQMAVAAGQAARPREQRQQEARFRVQKPGSGETSCACSAGVPVPRSARGTETRTASASDVGVGSVLSNSCD
jgi:hypothetical protein